MQEAKSSTELERIFAPSEAAPAPAPKAREAAVPHQDLLLRSDAVAVLENLAALDGGGNDRGYLGIVMDVEGGAMVVSQVMDGGPAAKAGLKAGDRITRIGDHKVRNQERLTAFLQGLEAGDEIELRIERDGWVREMEVELSSLSAIPGLPAAERAEIEPGERVLRRVQRGEDIIVAPRVKKTEAKAKTKAGGKM